MPSLPQLHSSCGPVPLHTEGEDDGGGSGRHRKTSKISSGFERRGCFPGNVRIFWINQIFTDCCVWRKTDRSHRRFTILGYLAEFSIALNTTLLEMRHREEKTLWQENRLSILPTNDKMIGSHTGYFKTL